MSGQRIAAGVFVAFLSCEMDGPPAVDGEPTVHRIDDRPPEQPGAATFDIRAKDLCGELEARAEELVASHRACNETSECDLLDFSEAFAFMVHSCLLPFQCFSGVRSDTDIDAFLDEAYEIEDAYRANCGRCIHAWCIDEELIGVACRSSRCRAIEIPPRDQLARP